MQCISGSFRHPNPASDYSGTVCPERITGTAERGQARQKSLKKKKGHIDKPDAPVASASGKVWQAAMFGAVMCT